MDARKIGMFDSGIGGITVFSEIIKKVPNEDIIYLGDTIHFPYGEKSKQDIINISKKCIDFLIKNDVKIIVIACGTATSQALEELKQLYNIPIIGIIEPTIKTFQNKNVDIAVLATKGTIKSNVWEKEIKKQNSSITITNKACPLLAPMAEEGWTDNDVAYVTLKEYLKDIGKVDEIILGCTHYPLFANTISKIKGDNVKLINTGEVLAEYLKKYLETNSLNNSKQQEGEYEFYLTSRDNNFNNLAKKVLKNEKIQPKYLEN